MRYCILSVIVLVFGCTNHKINRELNRVDELMNVHPDSAYTIIKSINPDDIYVRADKAFYALLYTQAQYKNYDSIRNDSLIDIAVDYYENKPLKDRLTRAYMYKAAALSDMSRHKEAIEWLKKAEQVADTSDYLTLGIINSHMGELYQKNFVISREDIDKYKNALKYYRLSRDKKSETYTLNSIGKLYRISNLDSATLYLQMSIDLSRELQDTSTLIRSIEMLAHAYILKYDYIKGKNTALDAYRLSSTHSVRLLCRLATAYSKLNRLDSADYFFNKISNLKNAGDSVAYYMTIREIAELKGDYKTALKANVTSTKIADRVINNARKNDVLAVERQFDKIVLEEQSKELETNNTIQKYLLIILSLVFCIVISFVCIILKRKMRIVRERALLVEQLKSEIDYQNSLISGYDARTDKDEVLKDIIKGRIEVIRKLAEVKYRYSNQPETFLKKFDEIIVDTKSSNPTTNQIIDAANMLNNNVIDKIIAVHPNLNKRDLLILSMTCLRFKTLEMCIYLNTPSIESTYMLRQRLLKKLNINSLDEYLHETARISV